MSFADQINTILASMPDVPETPAERPQQPQPPTEKPFYILRMTGRRANGHEGDAGSLYHAVKNQKALCGSQPGKRGGWGSYEGQQVTCKRCLKKLENTRSQK